MAPDQPDQWCPICGHYCRVRNDGCIARHPMRYDSMVEHLAAVVTGLERDWREPIWQQPNHRRHAMYY